MKEIVLINITGKDKPGLTASLTNILAQYEVTILDIGQAVIHDYLSLGILVEIPSAHTSSSILKDLLFQAHELGIQIRFSAIDEKRYEAWAVKYGRERRIITLLGRRLTAAQLSEVTAAIAANHLNIDVITRLSGRVSLDVPGSFPKACVQFTVSGQLDEPGRFRGRLLEISEKTGIDISFHVDDIYRHARRLVVFDMDSTLIRGEVIDGWRKAEILKTIATVENISLQQTIAIGDGANDLPMLSIAGLGIAFHAKSIVKKNAQKSISSVGLDGLLYLMGISEREIRQP